MAASEGLQSSSSTSPWIPDGGKGGKGGGRDKKANIPRAALAALPEPAAVAKDWQPPNPGRQHCYKWAAGTCTKGKNDCPDRRIHDPAKAPGGGKNPNPKAKPKKEPKGRGKGGGAKLKA